MKKLFQITTCKSINNGGKGSRHVEFVVFSRSQLHSILSNIPEFQTVWVSEYDDRGNVVSYDYFKYKGVLKITHGCRRHHKGLKRDSILSWHRHKNQIVMYR